MVIGRVQAEAGDPKASAGPASAPGGCCWAQPQDLGVVPGGKDPSSGPQGTHGDPPGGKGPSPR